MFNENYDNFHLIGFSLGGQIVGMIGRRVQSESNGKFIIPRITGLDPGQIPPFFGQSFQLLSPKDAAFVDVIHGETSLFGSAASNGHATFWVNGGNYQPACRTTLSKILIKIKKLKLN
jgi:hypothetical protein